MKVRETALNILCLLLLAALTSCTAPGDQAAPSGANAGSVGSDTTARPADDQVPVVTVASGMMDRAIELPAELQAFRDALGVEVFSISGVSGQGIEALNNRVWHLLEEAKAAAPELDVSSR